MNITLSVERNRVSGTIDGRDFALIRRGCETRLEGIRNEDGTFGGMVGSEVLRFGTKLLDGFEALTVGVGTWDQMEDEVAEEVYEAML